MKCLFQNLQLIETLEMLRVLTKDCLLNFFIPGSDRSEEGDLPLDVKEHLGNGEFALAIYYLK